MPASRYRRRPLEADALLWTGENIAEVTEFTNGHPSVVFDVSSHALIVTTVNGQIRCAAGDWLVCGVEGAYYPLRDAEFVKTYAPVDAV